MEMRVRFAWLRQADRSINEYSTPVVIDITEGNGDMLQHYTKDSDWYVAPEAFTFQISDLRGTTP